MSERFPDEVLQRAWEEGYDLFSHELLNNFDAPDRTVVVAAMRAVLEGHLAEQSPAICPVCGHEPDADQVDEPITPDMLRKRCPRPIRPRAA
jgi:hypothetical protein